MSDICRSEDGCDAWILKSGLLPSKGVYCDAGAAWPWQHSQTAFLRSLGWSGIAIDGNADFAHFWEPIEDATFVQAVLSDKPWVHFLREPTNAFVSRIHEEGIGVPAFKLRQVLESYRFPRIDFLAIDIESAEADVLRDYLTPPFWSDDLPKIVVAEWNSCHKGRDPEVFNVMIKSGYYNLVHMTDSNAVFAR